MQLEATVITIFAGQGPGQLGTGDRHRRFKGRIDDNPQLLVGITAPVQRQLRPLQGTGGGQFHVEGIIRAAVGVTGFSSQGDSTPSTTVRTSFHGSVANTRTIKV